MANHHDLRLGEFTVGTQLNRSESLALVLQASLLVRFAPPAVADAFCASRLNGAPGRTFGALPAGVATAPVLERALVLA